ncbi:CAP domain-containing protein, partial [Streptomyces sp. T-3]|nr:CAP domain-containing protein [Streptomyces sp. T-3]
MGRHRRSDAGPATEAPHQAGIPGQRSASSHRRAKRPAAPVRTGLLGVSAAVALGAVAVASGLLPGGDNYQLGGDGDSGKVRAASSPSDLQSQGGA